jgi:hypothetical protein
MARKEVGMKTGQILSNFSYKIPLTALALGLCLTASPARAVPAPGVNTAPFATQSEGLTDPKELEAFLDPLVADLMESHHIPGGAIAVVKDGQLFFAQGYGYADLEHGTPATADTTLFRVGSISKVFTWTAVMQPDRGGRPVFRLVSQPGQFVRVPALKLSRRPGCDNSIGRQSLDLE